MEIGAGEFSVHNSSITQRAHGKCARKFHRHPLSSIGATWIFANHPIFIKLCNVISIRDNNILKRQITAFAFNQFSLKPVSIPNFICQFVGNEKQKFKRRRRATGVSAFAQS